MAAVRASTRVSITWKGQDAYEDTDTLVLTIHDYSLDLRVFITGPQKGQIDWSTVAKVSELEGSTTKSPILKWDHIIDSRPPTDVEDQGTFATLDNGDVTETGRMFNPNTGEIEPYVETWHRFSSTTDAPYYVLELDNGEGDIGYIGSVGDHTLGCAKRRSGEYVVWREEKGSRVYTFGSVDSLLPSLPRALPEDLQKGDQFIVGGRTFIIRAVGITA